MLHATFASIEEGENMAARALGREELRFEWDAVRAVLTRYDAGQQAEMAALIQAYMGRTLSPHRQDFTALIGQAGEQVRASTRPITAISTARPMPAGAPPSTRPMPGSSGCLWASGTARLIGHAELGLQLEPKPARRRNKGEGTWPNARD
jgi:hypothetical protein